MFYPAEKVAEFLYKYTVSNKNISRGNYIRGQIIYNSHNKLFTYISSG